jgi:hypothetical protein
MITVYFETKNYSEIVATFEDEEVYICCLPALEGLAKGRGMFVTESVTEEL